jgi:electron transfer flavoprotein alpha subunit
MSVLVVISSHHGKIPKPCLEAVSYGKQLASRLNTQNVVFSLDALPPGQSPGKAGADRVLFSGAVNKADSAQCCQAIADVAGQVGAHTIVMVHDNEGKSIAPRVAARLSAGLVSGVVSLPAGSDDFTVNKNVFSGKAIASVKVLTANKVLTLLPNAFPVDASGQDVQAEEANLSLRLSGVKVREVREDAGDGVPLAEAEIVVSAGRGMKGPEHWGPVEELASILGAATACSRPVSDIGWRPHHEHVGQTGLTVRPNLYIAIGISGAIQHLAGVNGSKTIVVINKDPEAPFFKAADYGIVGDAFEILPKVITGAKAFVASR